MNINIAPNIDLDAQEVVTGRGCIIGQSGSGKSYLVGVVVEELCKNNLPFLIVDTEGEYHSLKSRFNVLWVGDEKSADARTDVNLKKLFEQSIDSNIPVILDVSGVTNRENYVYRALQELYSLEESKRAPYLVIIEEADHFAPQIVHPRVNPVEELSVRGRKRGIGLLVATQRPANVSKNVLAQCSYGFVGKLSIDNDIQAVNILFDDKNTLKAITKLNRGEFMPFGLPFKGQVHVKQREVVHAGSTPKIGEVQKSADISRVLKELKSREVEEEVDEPVTATMKTETLRGEAIQSGFSADDARAKAERLLKKRFRLFGGNVEVVESIKEKYLHGVLCDLRIPTPRKNEYKDHSFMLFGSGFLTVEKHLNHSKLPFSKPLQLTSNDIVVLSILHARGKADRARVENESGLDTAGRTLQRLVKAGLVKVDKGRYFVEDFTKYAQKERLQTKPLKTDKNSVMNFSKDAKRNTGLLVQSLFPGTQNLKTVDVYVPVYEVTLRHGSKVRVFFFDAIYLDDITELVNGAQN